MPCIFGGVSAIEDQDDESPEAVIRQTRKDVGKGVLTIRQAAELLGVPDGKVYRAASLLGARRSGGRLVFDRERIDFLLNVKTRKPNAIPRGHDAQEGERDSRVVAALESGATIVQIVVQERVPIRVAVALREEWLRAQSIDRQSVPVTCQCGAPSKPSRVARCERCDARTRTLTEAQLAVLAGKKPSTTHTACTGCGRKHPIDAVDRVCASCWKALTAVVTKGQICIQLETPNGPLTLGALSPEVSRVIASMVLPAAQPAPPVVEPPKPSKGLAEQIEALRAEAEKTDQEIAAAQAQIKAE